MGDSNRHYLSSQELYRHLVELFGLQGLAIKSLVLRMSDPRSLPVLELELYLTTEKGAIKVDGMKGALYRCQSFTIHPMNPREKPND